MKETMFCQSCAMPMDKEELFGKEQDGSRNPDYCCYCYKDGAFADGGTITMEEMIEGCIPHVLNGEPYNSEEEARAAMQKLFPQLKRWQKA